MADWITQVAEATGKTPQTIRLAIQTGELPIGKAVRLPDSRRYEYIPYPQKILELIGIQIGEDHVKEHSGTCRGNCTHCIASTGKRKET